MNRKIPACFVAATLAVLSTTAFADIVTLKSGTKIEGKITGETAAEITLSVKSGGVVDEQTVKKSDIASVAKDAPDEIAWQSLKNLKLGKNSLPVTSYDAVINPLKGFATEYPKSQFAAEAQKIADTFSSEKKRVEGGEVKLDDKWLGKEEAQKERYQIGALAAFNYMKEQGARDMTTAMNTFDAIEKNYPGARSYPDAVEYAQKILPVLKIAVETRTKALAEQKAEREKNLAALKGPEKTKAQDEIKREQTATEAALTAFEKQGNKWPPLTPANERSLQNLNGRISSETSRLASQPVAKMRGSVRAAEIAKEALDRKDLAAAEAALNKASGDWSKNELIARLREEFQSAKSIAAATPAAPAAPEPIAKAEPEKSATHAAAPGREPAAAEPEHATPFLLTSGGAITVVVAVALLIAGITVFKKIKARAGEALE